MIQEPFISIVVPFYNISEYVRPCLCSILSQEYNNYEVVCVDDGSTDDTLNQLKQFGRCERVRVFSKENGGLSDARNFGVTKALGDYISFVDGDDVVSPWYLSALSSSLCPNKNSFVLGQLRYINAGEGDIEAWVRPIKRREVSSAELLNELCFEKILPSACARLAPKSFYLQHPFPIGKRYEEISTILDYVGASDLAVVIDEPIYGYIMRQDSIVHKNKVEMDQIEDYEDALAAFSDKLKSIDSSLYLSIQHYAFICLHLCRLYRLLLKTGSDNLIKKEKSYKELVDKCAPKILSSGMVPTLFKIRIAIFSISPRLYDLFMSIYEAKVKNVG